MRPFEGDCVHCAVVVVVSKYKQEGEKEETIKRVITDSLWATKDAQKEGLEDIASNMMFIHGKSFHTVILAISPAAPSFCHQKHKKRSFGGLTLP